MADYTLRDLTSKDLFPLAKILGRIGLKEFRGAIEDSGVLDAVQEGRNVETAGFTVMLDVANIILNHLGDVEDDLYKFMASVSNLSRKQLENMPPADFVGMVIDVATKPEFSDFLALASKFRPSEN